LSWRQVAGQRGGGAPPRPQVVGWGQARGGEKIREEEVVDKGKKSSSGARKKARGRRTRALTLSHDRATHSDIL
jgi:hypothetical protein